MHYRQINSKNSAFSMEFSTEFAMLCTIYYLLYGSEFFSDSFFLQEVTVLLKKSKKSLTNPEKLILLYIETGSVKLSATFSVAEWTKRNLLGFVFKVYIKLISYSDFYVCYR